MVEIDKLALIFIKNKKLLATISKGKEVFFIPGGKREAGETDLQALVREIKEELSVEVIPETIKYFETFKAQAHGKPEGTIVKITSYTGELRGEPKAASEVAKIIWVDSKDLESATPVSKLVLQDLLQKNMIN
jgi:8-oxo-dGTP diphosphatase